MKLVMSPLLQYGPVCNHIGFKKDSFYNQALYSIRPKASLWIKHAWATMLGITCGQYEVFVALRERFFLSRELVRWIIQVRIDIAGGQNAETSLD